MVGLAWKRSNKCAGNTMAVLLMMKIHVFIEYQCRLYPNQCHFDQIIKGCSELTMFSVSSYFHSSVWL